MSLCLNAVAEPERREASLWRRLRYENDLTCRNALFERYRDLARKVARNEFHRRPSYGLDHGDFEQLAFVGLIEAIDRFDPLRGVPFRAYCRRRLVGSITDGLGVSSEAGHHYSYRSRLERDRLASLKAADEALPAKGDTTDYAQFEALIAGLAIGIILGEAGTSDPERMVDSQPNAYESLEWRDRKRQLASLVDELPERERNIIRRHYFDGISFRDIATLLKITPGRVSQIHKAALKRLQTLSRQNRKSL